MFGERAGSLRVPAHTWLGCCALLLLACSSSSTARSSTDNDGLTGERDGGASAGSDASSARDASSGKDAGASASKGALWTMMGFDEKNNYYNPDEHDLSVDNAPML